MSTHHEPTTEKHFAISITPSTLFTAFLVIIGLVALYNLRSLVLILLMAVVIASVIEPGTRWFVRRKFPRTLAAVFMYVLVVGGIVTLLAFLIPPLFSDAVGALNTIPKYIKTIDILDSNNQGVFNGFKKIFPDLPSTISIGDLVSVITASISDFSGGLFDTVSGFFGGVVDLLLVIVISFYLSVREDGVGEFLGIITPEKHEKYVRGLWRRTQMKIGRWMQGQLLLGLVVGVMVYLAMLAVGIGHPLILAVFAAIFELIPVIGMTLSAVPAFALATLDGGIGLGLIVVAIYLVIQQVEAHAIYPIVVKKIVGVPPLLVIISLVAGAELAGFVGVILAVPISVALVEYLDDIQSRKTASIVEIAETDGPISDK